MDLTALLNSNSSTAEQQETGPIRLPTRNRTPWDAGGYSLPFTSTRTTTTPIQTDINQAKATELGHLVTDEIQHRTAPSSPIHKFTDSRSSLSSFTSSLPSATHSRLSSISTVDGSHTFSNPFNGPNLSPKSTTPQSFEMSGISGSLPSDEDLQSKASSIPQAREDSSSTKSLDTLAVIAEHRQLGSATELSSQLKTVVEHDGQQETIQDFKEASSPITNAASWNGSSRDNIGREIKNDGEDKSWVNAAERPSSPSDTLLIKRPTASSPHGNPGEEQWDQPGPLCPQPGRYLSADLEHRSRSSATKSHKRALSAPNFAAKVMTPRRPVDERLHASTQNSDLQSTRPQISQSTPNSPTADGDAKKFEPVCMYIVDCDTGSSQRKAISHIFGRNKMCTRIIPDHVWVHVCRKHYQRSRYRNATAGYARVQCDLVQDQIRRINDWSLQNLRSGRGPYVQNWTLALRKREQKRIEEQGSSKRKRGVFNQEEHDHDIGYSTPGTAVPPWLLSLVGREFNTQGILDVFSQLHQHILDSNVAFPDIEILPNIVVGQDDAKPAKKSHQRTQSLSAHHESSFRDPAPKRRRQNELAFPDRNIPPTAQASRRPAFPNINEYEGDERTYSVYHQPHQVPLPAPTPQRMNNEAMLRQLETNNSPRAQFDRPGHNRSQSDFGSLPRSAVEYRPFSSGRMPPQAEFIGFPRRSSEYDVYQSEQPAYYPGMEVNQQPQRPQGRYAEDPNMNGYSQVRSYRPMTQSMPSNENFEVPSWQIDPQLHGPREMGHSRHFSSPMVPRQQYTIASSHVNPHQQIPIRTQGRQQIPSVPQIRETREGQEMYITGR